MDKVDINFLKFKETENLIGIRIGNKQKYFSNIDIIENSWTSRIDAQISNTFFLESLQLLINSIVLFEKGYFDCAFYSLRQSLEISTTIIYLFDCDENVRKEKFSKWFSKSSFPMYGQMIKEMKENEAVFSNIIESMSSYFSEIKNIKDKLNKYIHKQGLDTFYVTQNYNKDKNEERLNEYESFLKICIGAIAINRLAIDPFPVLLMEQEIYYRTFDLPTEPFTQEFIKDYIGIDNIEAYKKTDLYLNHYSYLIKKEKQHFAVSELIKNQFFDRTFIQELKSQKHLLSEYDNDIIRLFEISEKISKIHCCDGLMTYFSNIKSKRENRVYRSKKIKQFQESKNKYNLCYDNVFVSIVVLSDKTYCLEHNLKFMNEEICVLEFLQEIEKKLNHLKEK